MLADPYEILPSLTAYIPWNLHMEGIWVPWVYVYKILVEWWTPKFGYVYPKLCEEMGSKASLFLQDFFIIFLLYVMFFWKVYQCNEFQWEIIKYDKNLTKNEERSLDTIFWLILSILEYLILGNTRSSTMYV